MELTGDTCWLSRVRECSHGRGGAVLRSTCIGLSCPDCSHPREIAPSHLQSSLPAHFILILQGRVLSHSLRKCFLSSHSVPSSCKPRDIAVRTKQSEPCPRGLSVLVGHPLLSSSGFSSQAGFQLALILLSCRWGPLSQQLRQDSLCGVVGQPWGHQSRFPTGCVLWAPRSPSFQKSL